jgi:leucyl aminopeptidase
MELQQIVGQPLAARVDVLAFTTFGDPDKDPLFKAVDSALGGLLKECAAGEGFDGKPLQMMAVHTGGKLPCKRVVVVGTGSKSDFATSNLRDVAATVSNFANRIGATSVGFVLPSVKGPAMQLAAEGVLLGGYRFNRYLTAEDAKKPQPLASFGFFADAKGSKPNAAQGRDMAASFERAKIVAAAVNRARDLINEPAAAMTPTALAREAESIAKKHKSVSITVLGPKKCEELKMGMFLAVAQGSDQEPRFIHMVYKPAKKPTKRVALIGKGITFDSGGYSLKPSASMEDMKIDMSGAAAVISAMDAIATLGSTCEIHVIAPCCENLVSGRAFKLGDVLTSMDGTTVEINNTDAEGRLILGDAITYARTKVEPDEMFDFATLTGACMVALGVYTAGVFSDDDQLVKRWMNAAEATGEDMWRMPLNPRLRETLKSNVADMRNTGERNGGAISAGLFLKTFARDSAWLHVDLAGPASIAAARPSQPKGATGFAVATIVEYLTR